MSVHKGKVLLRTNSYDVLLPLNNLSSSLTTG